MEQLAGYVQERGAPGRRGVKRISVYLGLAVLLAAASLLAVNNRDSSAATKLPRVLVPHSGSPCSSPPNGFLYSNTVDGMTMNVCISQEGNINQINYPTATSPQIAWDGYCLRDLDANIRYSDYSPGSGVSFSGWNAATLTVAATNQVNVTRTSSDGKYQLTQFIKMNLQPRSVFVGMTIKNVDPANVTHRFDFARVVAPAIDGSAADDYYNELGLGPQVTGYGQVGHTGYASNGAGPGSNALIFGPTQQGGAVVTITVADYQQNASCHGVIENPGYVSGGSRVLVGSLSGPSNIFKSFSLPAGASAQVGKFVYRMF